MSGFAALGQVMLLYSKERVQPAFAPYAICSPVPRESVANASPSQYQAASAAAQLELAADRFKLFSADGDTNTTFTMKISSVSEAFGIGFMEPHMLSQGESKHREIMAIRVADTYEESAANDAPGCQRRRRQPVMGIDDINWFHQEVQLGVNQALQDDARRLMRPNIDEALRQVMDITAFRWRKYEIKPSCDGEVAKRLSPAGNLTTKGGKDGHYSTANIIEMISGYSDAP